MKKFLPVLLLCLLFTNPCFASNKTNFSLSGFINNDTRAIKSVLNSQVRYANRADFNHFINTYDKDYLNADGFDLETYSNIVKDIWNSYHNIKYGIKIKDIKFEDNNTAVVSITETSTADIPITAKMEGELKSTSNSIYYLKKTDGKWKVTSDAVMEETTSMMYGMAKSLDIKLTAPKEIPEKTEYTASLEFEVPEGVVAIASIAKDKVEYPQKQAEEVFRKMPEDNILERLFISNSDKKNEYIIASIGLTQADICDLSIKISLTGFGYQIIRVNVIPATPEGKNVKAE